MRWGTELGENQPCHFSLNTIESTNKIKEEAVRVKAKLAAFGDDLLDVEDSVLRSNTFSETTLVLDPVVARELVKACSNDGADNLRADLEEAECTPSLDAR